MLFLWYQSYWLANGTKMIYICALYDPNHMESQRWNEFSMEYGEF